MNVYISCCTMQCMHNNIISEQTPRVKAIVTTYRGAKEFQKEEISKGSPKFNLISIDTQ